MYNLLMSRLAIEGGVEELGLCHVSRPMHASLDWILGGEVLSMTFQ